MTTSFSYEDPLLRQQYSAGVTQKASVVMKDMAKGVYSQGKTFAKIGALYSAAECVIEGVSYASPTRVVLTTCSIVLKTTFTTLHLQVWLLELY